MEQEQHDLLIRLDERTKSINDDVILIKDDLKLINDEFKKMPCQVRGEKIKNLEKLSWGAIMVSIAAVGKVIWNSILK